MSDKNYTLDDLKSAERDDGNRYFFPDSNGAVHYDKETAEKIVEVINMFNLELTSSYDKDLQYKIAKVVNRMSGILKSLAKQDYDDSIGEELEDLDMFDDFQKEEKKEEQEKTYHIRIQKDWQEVTKQEYNNTQIGGLITDKEVRTE
jgi:hypothetical protein